jgi:hypothetical protein
LAYHRAAPKFTITHRIDVLSLEDAPLSAPINIHWNDHFTPFIRVDNERDLVVGMVLVMRILGWAKLNFQSM